MGSVRPAEGRGVGVLSLARDLQLARRAKKAGANYSLRIIREARRSRIPISLAFALVEQESGGRNIFGHDRGSLPELRGKRVTKRRVKRLLSSLTEYASNGVGLTQLTYPPFIRQADALGGAHIPKYQLRVGFGQIRDKLMNYGSERKALAVYNAGSASSPAGLEYARQVLAKQKRWHKVLTNGDD